MGRWTREELDCGCTILFYEDRFCSQIRINVLVNHCHDIRPEKIVIIPNGVDTEVFCPVEKDAANPLTVIWVDRLSAGKGLKYATLVLKSFGRLCRRIDVCGE